MSILTENPVEAVRANFQRLAPTERRELLQQLIADLDLPQRNGSGRGKEDATDSAPVTTTGNLLEWLEEKMNQADLETVLRQYLPDFSRAALTQAQQREMLNQRLSALGPVVLYELHQQVIRNQAQLPKLTPEEIIAKTWGTIRDVDKELLREIIKDDEDYCGY